MKNGKEKEAKQTDSEENLTRCAIAVVFTLVPEYYAHSREIEWCCNYDDYNYDITQTIPLYSLLLSPQSLSFFGNIVYMFLENMILFR